MRRLPDTLNGERWAFPLALWFVGGFFLLGDLGKWMDDWYYVQRVPETGAVRSLVLDQPVHFFRPLYRVVVPALQTLLWKADWANHLLGALAHGGAAALLWVLLRRCRLGAASAAVGALLFLTHPVHMEVVYWSSALPTALSTGLALCGLVLAAYARGAWASWAWMLVLFFAAMCLNEQPGALAASIPLVALAARSDGASAGRAVLGSIPGLAGAVSAVVLYVGLHVALGHKAPALGHGGLVAPTAAAAEHAWRIAKEIPGKYLLLDSALRAWERGVATLAEHPWRAAIAGVGAALGAVAWVRGRGRGGPGSARAGWCGAMGCAMFLAPLGLIAALTYWIPWRVFYVPTLGVCVLVAAVCSALERRAGGAGVRAASVVPLVVLAVLCVGFQRGFQDRSRADESTLRQLRALVPDPATGSVFVVARLAPPQTGRGRAGYDLFFRGVLGSWWGAPGALRMAYGRSDLEVAGPSIRGNWGSAVYGADERGILTMDLGPVGWERAVPFVVMLDGRVELVTAVESELGRYAVPQTARATERVFKTPPPPPGWMPPASHGRR